MKKLLMKINRRSGENNGLRRDRHSLKESSIKVRKNISASFGTVTFKHGTYSAAAIVLVIIIAVVINMTAQQLPENIKELDISSNKVYEISDTSREIIGDLEDDITITVIAEEDSLDDMLKTFLEKYVALSDHLSMEIIDPVLHPSALEEYDTESDTVIVSCESNDLSQTISISDILVQDMYSYYYSGTSSITEFDADGQLTSAISKVTGQEEKKIYCVTGHGESSMSSYMLSLMSKAAVDSEELNLFMTEEIPEDCEMLIFNGPTSDISDGEKDVVDNYIKSGGNVIILMSEETPASGNLADLTASYAITLEDGYVADMERNYLGNYYAIFPDITDTTGLTGDLDTGMVMVNNSRALSLGESSEELDVNALMETSDYGYLVSGNSEEEGSYVLAAAATYTATEDDETTIGNLVVFGSQSLIDESITEAFANLDNKSLFMNVMTSVLGDVQNLSIEAKSLEVQYNTVQSGGAISVFLIFVIPAAFLITGFIFWYRRRKV